MERKKDFIKVIRLQNLRSKERSVVGAATSTAIIGRLEIGVAGSPGSREIGDIVGNTTENGCDGGDDGNRGHGNGGSVDITVKTGVVTGEESVIGGVVVIVVHIGLGVRHRTRASNCVTCGAGGTGAWVRHRGAWNVAHL